ncbi:MAG: aminotransferase class I/II-fold pyridoxal phosphate-dependent enzyme [Rhodospirillaceae bacterium]|nr:MAG: aminotransferase class I/II-fold pyridoxal phosphate-dependent enzyme [Rhodospirillaceae bacterium]
MSLKIADRSAVDAFRVMDVMRAAKFAEQSGRAVYHLEVGQPGTPAPTAAREAVKRAVDDQTLGYTLALGTDELRAGIAVLYQRWYGLDLSPARITVTQGASGGFALAFLTAFDAGDRVALATPGYPCYRNILSALGLEAVEIMTGPDTHYQPTVEALNGLQGPIDGLILASPSNPTGSMLSPEAFGAINEWCRDRGVRLISDEIYHGLTYGTPEVTAAAINDDAFVVNSFSKYFSMTGWRVGWLVVPENMIRSLERLQGNMTICSPAVSQIAALGALEATEELEALKDGYRRNRTVLRDALIAGGISEISAPDGAFYLYAKVDHLTDDAVALCRKILEETGVAITPGADFDPQRGHHFMRLSYCTDETAVRTAADLLASWLREQPRLR